MPIWNRFACRFVRFAKTQVRSQVHCVIIRFVFQTAGSQCFCKIASLRFNFVVTSKISCFFHLSELGGYGHGAMWRSMPRAVRPAHRPKFLRKPTYSWRVSLAPSLSCIPRQTSTWAAGLCRAWLGSRSILLQTRTPRRRYLLLACPALSAHQLGPGLLWVVC